MGLAHQHGQRVKPGVGALRAGKNMAPRKKHRRVQRIGKRPHLRDHGGAAKGKAVLHQRLHLRGKGIFAGKIKAAPFQIAHPHGAVFPGSLRLHIGGALHGLRRSRRIGRLGRFSAACQPQGQGGSHQKRSGTAKRMFFHRIPRFTAPGTEYKNTPWRAVSFLL